MSYEGYRSFLCKQGHLHTRDVYADGLEHCPDCEAEMEWMTDTDETNGYIEDDPSTHAPSLEPITWDDVWHVDHYGNRYATKLWKWKPDGERWVRVK